MRKVFVWLGCLGTALLLGGCGSDKKSPHMQAAPFAATEARRDLADGTVVGFRDGDDTLAWLGIPYAQPPIGDLRWRAPRPRQPWQGVRDALQYGAFCSQFGGVAVDIPKEQIGQVVGSEDCLYLNIWSPRTLPADRKLPVMVWIHGGGNTVGHANNYGFARTLAGRQQVVVVTINYRLGIFGWFHHPALAAAQPDADPALAAADASGNFGTLDIIESLRWVQRNIAAFGGDPTNVTIFGESAGGVNVYSMLASPLSQGLFHKAISQSGGILTTSVAIAENFTDELPAGHKVSAKELSVALLQATGRAASRESAKSVLVKQSAEDTAAWLRSLSPAQIFAQLGAPMGRGGMLDLPRVIGDGLVLPARTPRQLTEQPDPLQRVPLITGTNRDEMRTLQAGDPRFVRVWFGLIPRIRDRADYARTAFYGSNLWRLMGADLPATALSARVAEPPVFVYRFDYDQLKDSWLGSLSAMLGAGHALEIPYVFGLADNPLFGFKVVDDDTLAARERIAAAMSSYWANFAYTGAPGRGRGGDLPEWKAWSNAPGGPKSLLIDADNRGGIRQAHESLTLAGLKHALATDETLLGDQEALCRTYARVFYRSLFGDELFDAQQYAQLGREGCAAWPVASFEQ